MRCIIFLSFLIQKYRTLIWLHFAQNYSKIKAKEKPLIFNEELLFYNNITINMSISDRKTFLKILIIACFALISISAASRKMSIQSVSLSPHQFIRAQGLERGETVLYVTGSGFNANGKGITVYFGSNECNVIPQESTSTMIKCKTSPLLKDKQRQNLPVTIYMVNSLPATCYTSKCLFSYLSILKSEISSEDARILNEGSPILKITCTAAGQYDGGAGVCESCVGVENSPGTVATSRKACNCNPTFVWNSTQKACKCPLNSIINNGKCQSCGPLKTKYGTGLSTGNDIDSVCQCNPTFIFNLTTFSCVCQEPKSFINSSNLCFPCADKIINGTGQVNASAKACACFQTFVWNAKLNDCYCPTDGVFNAETNKCFSCSSLKGKNSTGVLLSNNTCQCIHFSYIFVPENNTCICPDPNSYIDKTTGACVPCSDIGNSSNNANIQARTCQCLTNFTWNYAKNKTACLCPQSSIIYANQAGEEFCFQCSRLKGKNGTGLVNKTDSKACQCLNTFVFNPVNNTCQCPDPNSYINKTGACVPCSEIINGTGIADRKNQKCICLDSTFVWTPNIAVPACICPVGSVFLNNNISCYYCSLVKAKNGTGLINSTNPTICACLPTFVFNTTSGACQCPDSNSYVDKVLGCISCTNVSNSSGVVNSTTKVCACLEGFVWNPKVSLFDCFCPTNSIFLQNLTCFNCGRLKGRNSTGLVNKTDFKVCQCLKSFVFKTDTNTCQCPDPESFIYAANKTCIPCKDIGNSTGTANKTSNTCNCPVGFIWTPTKTVPACMCPFGFYLSEDGGSCISCLGLKQAGKNGTGLVNKTNNRACQCLPSFVYDNSTNTCSCQNLQSYIDPKTKRCVSCVGVGNGTGTRNTSTSCGCQANFVWTPTLKVPACVCAVNSIVITDQSGTKSCYSCATNKNKNFTGSVNIANFSSCACLKSFIWNNITLGCQCPDPNSYIDKTTGLCVSCTNITNGSGTADVTNRKCVCKDSTYVWAPIAKPPGCYCLPNSAIINGSCFLCTGLKGKNGTGVVSTSNSSLCACLKSFVFNTETKACQCPETNSFVDKPSGLCITCNGVGNSSGEVNSSATGCKCTDTFVWDSTKSKTACLCSPLAIFKDGACFLCSSLTAPNATGKVNSTNKALCQCARSYIFDTTANTCICPEDANSYISATKLCISCLNVANSPGSVNDTTGKTCNCNENFVYSTSTNKCTCNAPNKLVDGVCTLPASALSIGSCPNDTEWSSQLQICVCKDGFANIHSVCVSCGSIQNSNGSTGSNKISCQCESGYHWNVSSSSCTSS